MFGDKKRDKATVDNDQVLYGKHNCRRKTYDQAESGKQMFINLYKQLVELGGKKLAKFYETVLEIYEKQNINSHVKWKR